MFWNKKLHVMRDKVQIALSSKLFQDEGLTKSTWTSNDSCESGNGIEDLRF